MNRLLRRAIPALLIISMVAGCSTALVVGDRTIGIRSGKFIFTDGTLRTDYQGASFERVWQACEATIKELKAAVVAVNKKIASGAITANLQGEEVAIVVQYVERDITTVAVRVGIAGDNVASQMIHDKIRNRLGAS
ncbi:MAG: DUF3568 family protein [Deltaproteobacteria bacterium]|nr:DUF3568 family protein [Deltaproteobacteria bacterium]